jgi:hypothetical protein
VTYAEARPEAARVRLYAQSPAGGGRPRLETVTLSVRCDRIGPGPSDDRIYTISAPEKHAYGRDPARKGLQLPPWRGPIVAPVKPSPDGQFDRLRPGDPGFRRVHLYGCVRFALDVWERHVGHPIPWHFAAHYPRLELVALRGWANAHMGYGYLEVGDRELENGDVADLALDFDVIAHEVGHALLLSFGGRFDPRKVTPDFEALHEASADWAAMIAALHFETLLEELLEATNGDLDGYNRLNRFAEFSASRQVRLANNDRTMWDFVEGWRSEHELSLPLLAALWDGFVEVYNELLVAHGAIPRAVEALAERARVDRSLRLLVAREFARHYRQRPEAFHGALVEAREIAAIFLVGLWARVEPTRFRFGDIARFLDEVDRERFSGQLRDLVQGRLRLRGIGVVAPGPRLAPPGKSSHVHSSRTAAPD